MKKITARRMLAALLLLVLVGAGCMTQAYLKDNLVVSIQEKHDHAHAHVDETEDDTTTDAITDNLVANYSFEVGTDLAIDGWSPEGEDPGTSAWRDTSVSAYGFSSAALSSGSGSRGVDVTWNQSLSSVPSDKDVTIKGFIKTEDLRGGAFLRINGLQMTSEGNHSMVWLNLDSAGGTSDWTEVEGKFYLPAEVNAMEVSAGIYGEGRAWFDEISLKASEHSQIPLERNVNLLRNPDFSQGLLGWNYVSVPGTPQVDWGIRDGGNGHGPSLYLTQTQPGSEKTYAGFYQTFNDLYRTRDNAVFTGWVKTSGLEGSAWLNLSFFCLDTRYVMNTSVDLSGTREWQPLELNVQVPENADSVWARVMIDGKGTVFFDDLDFRLVPPGSI